MHQVFIGMRAPDFCWGKAKRIHIDHGLSSTQLRAAQVVYIKLSAHSMGAAIRKCYEHKTVAALSALQALVKRRQNCSSAPVVEWALRGRRSEEHTSELQSHV